MKVPTFTEYNLAGPYQMDRRMGAGKKKTKSPLRFAQMQMGVTTELLL
jgi:hypothetical protein